MNRSECTNEKISSRTVGLILLPLGLLLGGIGFVLLPVFGLFFALPVLLLSAVMLFAPESRACKLLTGKRDQAI